jgi:RNA polymerase sigma-70 factor (ECF subfamily)
MRLGPVRPVDGADDIEDAVRRVKEGSLPAYETIVRAYQARLRALLAHAAPPGIDADELAHHAFVEGFRRIDAYTPGTNLFAWLAAIGRNLLLMELRRNRNELRKHDRYARQVVEVMEAELRDREELDETRVETLRDCLRRLPAPGRALLDMRYAEGVPVQTMAERLGKSAAAIKFQLFDIRRRLKQCVDRKLPSHQP